MRGGEGCGEDVPELGAEGGVAEEEGVEGGGGEKGGED